MLVMAYLGQALTDAVPPARHALVLDPLRRDHPTRRQPDLRGPCHRVIEHNGERRAKLALTTRDENGEIKLAGEAIIAI